MKKPFHTMFFFFLAALTFLTGCEKEDVLDNMIIPRTAITFDDNIEKITADYRLNTSIVLKISGLSNATSVTVTSRYTAGSARSREVATLTPVDGVATLNVPVSALRNTADGPIVGATTVAATRTANTYALVVQATLPDNTTEQRFFNAVIVQ